MIVNEVKVYSFKRDGKEYPRVRVVVEGYEFIFGRDERGRPVRIVSSGHAHPQIKRRATAIAAVQLKHRFPLGPVPIQKKLF